MPKDVSGSVYDSLAEAAVSITKGMMAPDAGPMMPKLEMLFIEIRNLAQKGQGPGQQQPGQGQPPQGQGPPQGGPPPGGPQGPPQAPGPPAQGMPNAGGQGLFPNSPQPNANELAALISQGTGK